MRKLYLWALVFLLPAISHAQIYWDFSTATPLSGVPANVTVSAVTQGNNNGTTTLLTTTSASSGYAGASGGNNAGAAAFIGAFDSTASTYFQWTITPASGVVLTISQVNFGARSTGTGPKAYDIRTSLDGFASAAATAAVSANSVWALNSNTVNLTTAAGQPVTIRIYGYNGTGNPGASTANWRIDDLSLTVSTTGGGGGTTVQPSVQVSPGSLSGFTTTSGAPSAAQTLTVSGSNLTDNILVAAPNGFEVSTDDAAFADSVSIQHTGDTAGPVAVFVRIGASASGGNITGNLAVKSTGAVTQQVSLSGTVNVSAAKVVINQIYGGGGNSGSAFSNDYIELFNDDDTAVSLNGWSVQYASATGTGTFLVTPLSGTIPPHSFYLIQEAAGATPNNALPTPDAVGTTNMSATAGKVILSNSTAVISGANPPDGGNIIDKVGYGSANGFETAPAPVLTNSTADARITPGADNDNNSTDFQVIAPLPRNTTYTTTGPVLQNRVPANGSANVPSSLIPILVFNKPIVRNNGSITLVTNAVPGTPIPVSDPRIAVSNDSVVFNLPLAGGNNYSILIPSGAFTDAFGNSFGGLTADTSWTFSTFNNTVAQPLPFITSFDNCTGSGLLPNGFTAFSVTGAQVWDCTTFGRDSTQPAGTSPSGHAIEINGFANGINNVNQDWLITPRFDLSSTIFPLLGFWSRNAFQGAPLTLKISTDYTGSGNPAGAHWTDLNGKFPSVASDVWTQSANIDLSGFKQSNVYIAFVYSSTSQDGSRWTLDDFSLINSPTPPPPSLTLSTNDLEFGFTQEDQHAVQKVTITGADLTSPIRIKAEGNFKISTDSIHYRDSVTLQGDSTGSVTDPIFVRFTPTIANAQFIDSVLITISDSVAILNVKGNSIDPASILNIVDWNLNWFGTPDSTLGPANKPLQEKNVGTILPQLHADLYALEEVCSQDALDSIVATMPGYAYVVGQYGSFSNPTIPGGPDPLNTVQKLAFVYNTAKISVVRTDSLLTLGTNNPADPSTVNYNDWSSGRFPYMLTANVSLAGPNGTTNTKTVRFINVHAKANTSPILTAYNRRADGARVLDSLIKAQYPSDNVVILGDFNDDLNQTITSGITPPVTSWSSFTIADSTLYQFPTKPLSPAGQHSDVNFTSVIDNVILNDSMAQYYLPNSATVLSNVGNLVPNYGTTTTDHYPVFTQYSFTPPVIPPAPSLTLTAIKKGNFALLNWTTTGINTTRIFEVQRSRDKKTFLPIGLVEAIRHDDSIGTYAFTDFLPPVGTDYYRLRLIDGSGPAGFSDTVSLTFTPPLTIHLLPNPAIGATALIVTNADAAYTIQVLDLNGRIVRQLTGLPGTPVIPINLIGLRGIYTVQVVTPTQIASEKLVVL